MPEGLGWISCKTEKMFMICSLMFIYVSNVRRLEFGNQCF